MTATGPSRTAPTEDDVTLRVDGTLTSKAPIESPTSRERAQEKQMTQASHLSRIVPGSLTMRPGFGRNFLPSGTSRTCMSAVRRPLTLGSSAVHRVAG